MKKIYSIPPRIWDLMRKYDIKTNYKSGLMTEDQYKNIVDQIKSLQLKKGRY